MKTILPLLIVLFISFTTKAQERIKYGKISPADLAMKVYPQDTDAAAVILSKIGLVNYDVLQEKYRLTEERHVVIKLLKEAGIDEFGNVEIPFYAFNDNTRIRSIKGVVHLPDGTDEKLDNSQILEEKTNEFWSTKKIAFPKLVPGAIIEYQYVLESERMFQPVDWFFQSSVPVRYSELTTKIPEWYEYVVLIQGSPLDKETNEIKTIQVSSSSFDRGNASIYNRDKGGINVNTAEVRYLFNTYININVPSLKKECCITTMEDYYTRVRYQLNAYHFPGSSREPVMGSWKKLAEELYAHPEWGGQLRNDRPGELVLEAAGIKSDTTHQLEIAQKLYDYVNNNIQWNDIYGCGTSRDISSILKSKTGESGDLNKLMCAALKQAGIQAEPVLLSTRRNGKPLELYPFLDQFNHMVVLATINGKDTWIDAGDKHLPLGSLRTNALNARGWIVDKDNPEWTDLPTTSSKSTYLITGTLDKDGNLNATMESRYTGYHAVDQRDNYEEEKEKFGQDLLMNGTTPLKLSDIEAINAKETSMPFQLKAKILTQSVATATPDKIYLNAIFPDGLADNPFKLTERTYPIEINYPEEIMVIMNLTLPEGYIVESAPDPLKFLTENSGIMVTYNTSQPAGKISVTMKYVIQQLEFAPEEYAAIKNFYNERHQKFNEQIVLTKS